MFPAAAPLKTGYLQVSDMHRIFYLCFGNPQARPVICLHGGPGVGCYPRMMQYFNPEKFFIVLFDQRGAGRSTPSGELRENTTSHLVEDVEKLRKHLELGPVLIFGGSWGSTLGLAYAETYPENVTGMLLRGIFLGTEAELQFHYMGTAFFFPKEHAALKAVLPDPTRDTHPDYLSSLILGNDKAVSRKVQDALGRFEMKFMKLNMPDETVESIMGSGSPEEHFQMTSIDLHYVSNRYFLEEGQLLKNAEKIKGIPITLINGRYDMAAPPISAFKMHERLPGSKLIIVEEAGHSESEERITKALLKAVTAFESP
ncbi:MAG: prolyl aminopeptidase [Planctomycetota bacterium]